MLQRCLPLTLSLAATVVCFSLAAPPPSADASQADSMVRELNRVRALHDVGPLRTSRSLTRSSSAFAHFLMRSNYFGHMTRIRASGRFRRLGEVLEWHRGRRAFVRRTVRAWLRSPGHRRIVLSPRFRWAGAGRTTGHFRGRATTIWVAHFGG